MSALISPMFNGWCVDFDRPADVGKEQIVNIYSSYEASGFPDSSFDPKEDAGPENGRSTASVLLTPSENQTDRLVFSSNHGLATGTAVRVTTSSDTLLQSNVYYTAGPLALADDPVSVRHGGECVGRRHNRPGDLFGHEYTVAHAVAVSRH